MSDTFTTYNLTISKNLLDILNDYMYEVENDSTVDYDTLDDFIVQAIVEKYNNLDEKLTSGEIDEYGFTDGRSFTEHFLD